MTNESTIQLKEGRLLGYAEYGDPHGKPIFYFHGFPGSRLEASSFHETALAKHCRLIGIDRPGFGLSSLHNQRSLLSWASDVENFANALGIEKFSIVGHSGGGPFVMACACAIPHRLNGAAIVSGFAPVDQREIQMNMKRSQKTMNTLIQKMPWLTSLMMRLTRLMLKSSGKMMKSMIKTLPEVDQVFFQDPDQAQKMIANTLEAFRHGVEGPAQEMKLLLNSWGFDLENIAYSVSIWHGVLDKQVPVVHAKIVANLLSHSQLKIFDCEGHHSLIKNHIEEIFQSL